MNHLLSKVRPSVCLGIGTVWAAAAIAFAESPAPTTAEGLLRQALRAEVDNQPGLRDTSLKDALRAAPDFAQAHWHSGHVRGDGQWLTVPEAERRAAMNSALASYTQLRDSSPDSAAAHQGLAVFCRKNGLLDRERWHWANVLRFDRQNKDAIRALGLRKYQNQWLTDGEIELRERASREYTAAERRWQPTLQRLRKSLESDEKQVSEAALTELRSIRELIAIPFLDAEFADAAENVQLEFVGVLAKMSDQAATEALLRRAVLSPSAAMREAAADELKGRPVFAYMPTLMGCLEAPIELTYYLTYYMDFTFGLPRPGTSANVTLFREGPLADQLVNLRIDPQGILPLPKAISEGTDPVIGLPYLLPRQAFVPWVRQAVARANATAEILNPRIIAVLRRTTGLDLEDEPHAWWKWWADYNELYATEERPVIMHRGHFYGLSCFPPGTMVWTETGPMVIEKVRVGDRVLSQSPESGELAYKLVVGTTMRPPSPILRLVIEGQEIGTTRGHLFSRVGDAWRMAKELRTGDRLHGIAGAVAVDRVDEWTTCEAYNLIVQEFATYFVGEPRLLVHDNTARQVTTALVPGLADDKRAD